MRKYFEDDKRKHYQELKVAPDFKHLETREEMVGNGCHGTFMRKYYPFIFAFGQVWRRFSHDVDRANDCTVVWFELDNRKSIYSWEARKKELASKK